MFDFDIENIINIQPKTRKKINIFDNLHGHINKSSIVNNSIISVKNERKIRNNSNPNPTLLENALQQNIAIGPRIVSAGIETLKPELICAMEFTPTSDEITKKFINYSFTFREYKRQQINNILDIIENADTPDADNIKLLRKEFQDNLDEAVQTLTGVFSMIQYRMIQAYRGRFDLAEFTDLNSIQEGTTRERIANKLLNGENVANQYNSDIFRRLTVSKILNYLIVLMARYILFTSPQWDSEYVSVTHTAAGGLGNYSRAIIRFQDRSSLSQTLTRNLSPFHFITGPRFSGSKSLIDTLLYGNTANNISRIQLYISLLTSEYNISRSIYDTAQSLRNDVPQISDILNIKQVINGLMDSSIMNVPLIMNTQNVNDEPKVIMPLEYVAEQTDRNGEEITYDELVNRLFADSSTYQSAIMRWSQDVKRYLDAFFPYNVDSNSSIIQTIVNNSNLSFTRIRRRIARVFNNVDGIGWFVDRYPDQGMHTLIEAAKNNPLPGENGAKSMFLQFVSTSIIEVDDVPRGGVFRDWVSQSVSKIFLYALIGRSNDGGASQTLNIARYISMLLLSKSEIGFIQAWAVLHLNDNLTDSQKGTLRFWHEARTLEQFINENLKIAFKKLIEALNRSLELRLSRDTLNIIGDHYSTPNVTEPVNIGQTNAIAVKFAISDVVVTEVTLSSIIHSLYTKLYSSPGSLINETIKQFTSLEESASPIYTQATQFPINGGDISPYSAQQTYFSNFERSTMLLMFFDVIRRIMGRINPFTMTNDNGAIKINVDISDQNNSLKFANIFMAENNIEEYSDYTEIMRPLSTQYSDNAYNTLFKPFIHNITNSILPGIKTSQENPLLSELEINNFQKLEKSNIPFTDLFKHGKFLDQIPIISTGLIRASKLTHEFPGVINLENHITNTEKRVVINDLTDGRGTLIIPENIDIGTDPFLRVNNAGFVVGGGTTLEANEGNLNVESKLLVIGIPVGFRNEMNKLYYEQRGTTIANLADDTFFSKISVEVWGHNVGLENYYYLVKRSKFDLDYFVYNSNESFNDNVTSINHLMLYDQGEQSTIGRVSSDPPTRNKSAHPSNRQNGRVNLEDDIVITQDQVRRRNEAMSYILKRYIQLIYGINFNEEQFFIDRDILLEDSAGSNKSEFVRKFQSIVNNLTNDRIKRRTLNQKNLTKNIETLIASSDRTSILRQFSNDVIESTHRQVTNRNLTNEERELAFELEDMALKVSSAFRYSEELSGGPGYIKRLLAPKLFEKILIIDIPVLSNDINDYYVKIVMDTNE